MRILIVEDEPKLADDLCRVLKASGFVPEATGDGEEAWFLGDTEYYAGIILDLGLPKMDGLSVLRKWRQNGRPIPILVLTARASWTERVEGIDAGADDYLAKPFHMEELLARLHAILRRSAGQPSSQLVSGPVTLDARQMRVCVNGMPVPLTPLEYRALAYLMHHHKRIVPPHELSEHVYGIDSEKDSNVLEVLIARLRRKLGVKIIETRRGYGYTIGDGS